MVVKGPYNLVWEKESSPERARMMADAVTSRIEDDGWEAVQLGSTCDSVQCLEKVAREHEAHDAVYISVKQDSSSYNLMLFHIKGRSIARELTGPFSKAIKEVESLAAEAIGKPDATATEETIEPQTTEPQEPDEPAEAFPQEDSEGRRLSPPVFWTSIGITGALAISLCISEAVAGSRIEDLEDTEPVLRKQSDWEDMKKAVVIERVFLGLTMAGAATTAVLFFLTDFKQEKSKSARLESIAPAAAQNGGMLVLQGSFR